MKRKLSHFRKNSKSKTFDFVTHLSTNEINENGANLQFTYEMRIPKKIKSMKAQ